MCIFSKLAVIIVVFLGVLGLQIANADAPVLDCNLENKSCVFDWISHYSVLYGIDIDFYSLTIKGESSYSINPKGYNDAGKAYGIAQYHRETFYRHAKSCGWKNAEYKNPQHQMSIMACAFSKGWWTEWTAARNLVN